MRNRLALLCVSVLFAASVGGIPPPLTAPSITSVVPSIGRPAGGEMLRITGTNFVAPVRVLFQYDGKSIEAMVVSIDATARHIDVITPAVLLENTQRMPVDVQVISRVGTNFEMKTTAEKAFTYQKYDLVPAIQTVTPNHASIAGGARVTIFGEGFQQPVAVYFEQDGERREARVLNADFAQIIAEAPAGLHTGFADVIVRNYDTGREARLASAFRYTMPIQVASISPSLGPATGGTLVRISGSGFIAPVWVTIGNIPVQVLSVTGTDIVVRTNAAGCNDDGPVTVFNLASGDTATGPVFEYRCPRRRAA